MAWGLYWLAWAGALLWPLILALVWRDARRRRAGRWSALRWGLTGGVSVAWLLGIWAFLVEPDLLVVRHVAVTSAQWRGAPVRIGMISDTHVGGPHVSAERIARVVARMNAEQPDLVVLLGDYVGGHAPREARTAEDRSEIEAGIAAFAQLRAPLGVIAVYGNHDWWYDGERMEALFQAAGIPLPENQPVRVSRAGGEFYVSAMADEASFRMKPSFLESLIGVPDGADIIAIAHRPDVFSGAPARVAITLAGHSHCGQVNLPVLGRVLHASPGSARWSCGLYEVEDGRQLYVTGGVGVSILPVRFNQPPEIVILTLSGAGVAP
jgi:uncharacterized protein